MLQTRLRFHHIRGNNCNYGCFLSPPIHSYIYVYTRTYTLDIFSSEGIDDRKVTQLRFERKISFTMITVYPKKYAHGYCFAVLCCCYTLTDFPISIRLTSLALWQSNDCPIASKATLVNMDKYFMWIHYERLHNHNKAKHNKTVCIFLGIYCIFISKEVHNHAALFYTHWCW